MSDNQNNQPKKYFHFTTLVMLALKEQRMRWRITQATVAEACGITASTYSKLETGDTSLSIETLIRICGVVKANPAEVFWIVEQNAQRLEQHGYELASLDDSLDTLHTQSLAFFDDPIFGYATSHPMYRPMLNRVDQVTVPALVQFCYDSTFRNMLLSQSWRTESEVWVPFGNVQRPFTKPRW